MKVKTNSKGFNNLNEGRTLTIDKELTGDQKTLEVGKELPKSTKIEKNDKQSLEDFKYVYKDSIYNKCMETYGTCDDKDLLDDIAKELYLSSKNYIPDETKNDGELEIKTESLKKEKETKVTLNESSEPIDNYKKNHMTGTSNSQYEKNLEKYYNEYLKNNPKNHLDWIDFWEVMGYVAKDRIGNGLDESKNDGELDVKTESKCIINHHKKVENKLIEDKSKYNELSKYKDYYIASAFLDLVSDNLISNEIGNLVLSKMKEYGYKPTENDIKSECSKQNNKLNKECSKQN